MELRALFVWLMNGGGAGAVAYWLMNEIKKHANINAEWTRYLSLALAAGIATLAFYLGTRFGYEPTPATTQGWIEAITSVIAVALGLSQAIHGFVKARKAK